MPNPLNNVAVPNNDYTDACTISDIAGGRGGSFAIAGFPVLYALQYGSRGAYFWTDDARIEPGGGSIEPGATGVRFKNATAGSVATVSARIAPPAQPLLQLGYTGAVTIAGASGLTGIVASNGAITAGTGFSVNRTGPGVYVVTFTTALAAVPIVIVGSLDGALNGRYFCADSVTVNGFTARAFNAIGDAAFNFITQAVA